MAKETDVTLEKKKLVLSLFVSKAGNVAELCRSTNISRQTFYRWCKEDAVFNQAIEDGREGLIDFAESKLFSLIDEKHPTAIIFFLKTKAKHRGYIEKSELEHSGDVNIKYISHIPHPDKKPDEKEGND